MMKNVSVCKVILAVILYVVVFLPCIGCSTQQMGETSAEGHRRHIRTYRTNQQELMNDIDKALLLDRPSKLTDKRIP